MRDLQSRVLLLFGSITVALLLLGLQLYKLTVAESAAWMSRANQQTEKTLPSLGPRGSIFDRSGRLVATSEPVFAAMLVNQDPDHVAQILPKLADVLADGNQAKAAQITETVMARVREHVNQWRQFEDLVIATNLSPSVVTKFTERQGEFPGVSLVIQSIRRYPEGELAGPVIGYVGRISEEELEDPAFSQYPRESIVGKGGLEKYYESELQGKVGTRSKVIDPMGRPIGITQETPPEPGNNLILSLDLDLQKVAEKALAEQIEWIRSRNDPEANPIRGALVALDVKTGAVLAMAQTPTYDPSLFVRGMTQEEYDTKINIPGRPLINWSITGYPPGSTYKMGVGMAGVQLGQVGLRETVHCSRVYERDPTRHNWYPGDQGFLSLDMALAWSCNPYFYETGFRLGIDTLAGYLSQFGFGQRTGIDLPFEDPGDNPTQASYGDGWQPGQIFSVSIGQGNVRTSALQLAVYTATIANSGVRYQPYLVSEIRSPSGELLKKHEPIQAGTVEASPELWREVQLGLWKGANNPVGTAYTPFLGFPMEVAAKTGSAETGLGYANALTVAYAPAKDPQIAVAVIVEGGAHGSWVAPPARAVFAHYFGIQDRATGQSIPKAD